MQPYRLVIATGAGGFGAVLATVYDDIGPAWRVAAIVAFGLLTVGTLALAEPTPSRLPGPVRRRAGERARVARRRPQALPGESATLASRPSAESAVTPPPAVPRWRRWPPRAVVPSLPNGDVLFRGRGRELQELIHRHDTARAARSERRAGQVLDRAADSRIMGPILLPIHGKPGVGKSALALELGRHLKRHYPHGQIYVPFGMLNGPRTPGDVLAELLLALGWPVGEIPHDVVGRAKIFRSITARRRILFLFDAVRNANQVRAVLPADLRCAVIVTSRRDLTAELGTHSYGLDVPDMDEAITILRAASGTDEGTRPEYAVQIVNACGALPLALRAAAERALTGGTELGDVAHLLEPEPSRLGWLERPGAGVAERIASEYDRLLDQEQRALRLLTLVESPTFVPWVLTPLLDVPPAEADILAVRLGAAQMLDAAGRDEPTGLARYRFHPLVRLFAQARLHAEGADEHDAARRRLDNAYREIIGAVLGALDPTFVATAWRRYLPGGTDLVERIARHPRSWVREELPTLLRQIHLAEAREPGLSWRIAAWLGGYVPPDVPSGATLRAYAQATEAAEADRAELGLAQVLLAKGSFLVAIENYAEAENTLGKAAEEASRLVRLGDDGGAALLHVQVQRKRGEGYLQMASYPAASRVLRVAAAAAAGGYVDELGLIQLLLAETHHIDAAAATYTANPGALVGDEARFRASLVLAESSRRRHEWSGAQEYLAQALRLGHGDAHRTATVLYRTAGVHLGQHLAEHGWPDLSTGPVPDDPDVVTTAELAIRRAAEAAVMFQRMGNPSGTLRAHCQLARALLAAGYLVEAERVANGAFNELSALTELYGPDVRHLAARVRRTFGDLMMCRGDLVSGRRLLLEAAAIFAQLDDRAGEGSALRRLEEVRWKSAGAAHQALLDDASAWPPLPREWPSASPGWDDADEPGWARSDESGYGKARDRHHQTDPGEPNPPTGNRMVHAWLDNDTDSLQLGETITVRFAVGGAATENVDPRAGGTVTVMLVADSADVSPYAHTVELHPIQPLEPLTFSVTPKRTGSLSFQFRIYATRDGLLLQELRSAPVVIQPAMTRAVSR